MKVDYGANNQTEISKILEGGKTELDISFYAVGLLKDLPSQFIIPEYIFKEYFEHSDSQFFLNVDYNKHPPEWVVDCGERPL